MELFERPLGALTAFDTRGTEEHHRVLNPLFLEAAQRLEILGQYPDGRPRNSRETSDREPSGAETSSATYICQVNGRQPDAAILDHVRTAIGAQRLIRGQRCSATRANRRFDTRQQSTVAPAAGSPGLAARGNTTLRPYSTTIKCGKRFSIDDPAPLRTTNVCRRKHRKRMRLRIEWRAAIFGRTSPAVMNRRRAKTASH